MGCGIFNGLGGIGGFFLCEGSCWGYPLDGKALLVSEAICSLRLEEAELELEAAGFDEMLFFFAGG